MNRIKNLVNEYKGILSIKKKNKQVNIKENIILQIIKVTLLMLVVGFVTGLITNNTKNLNYTVLISSTVIIGSFLLYKKLVEDRYIKQSNILFNSNVVVLVETLRVVMIVSLSTTINIIIFLRNGISIYLIIIFSVISILSLVFQIIFEKLLKNKLNYVGALIRLSFYLSLTSFVILKISPIRNVFIGYIFATFIVLLIYFYQCKFKSKIDELDNYRSFRYLLISLGIGIIFISYKVNYDESFKLKDYFDIVSIKANSQLFLRTDDYTKYIYTDEYIYGIEHVVDLDNPGSIEEVVTHVYDKNAVKRTEINTTDVNKYLVVEGRLAFIKYTDLEYYEGEHYYLNNDLELELAFTLPNQNVASSIYGFDHGYIIDNNRGLLSQGIKAVDDRYDIYYLEPRDYPSDYLVVKEDDFIIFTKEEDLYYFDNVMVRDCKFKDYDTRDVYCAYDNDYFFIASHKFSYFSSDMALKAMKIEDYLNEDYSKLIDLGTINTRKQKMLVTDQFFFIEEYDLNDDVFKSEVRVHDLFGKYIGKYNDDLHMRINNDKISYYDSKYNMLVDLDNPYTYQFKNTKIIRDFLGLSIILSGLVISSPLNILKRGDE